MSADGSGKKRAIAADWQHLTHEFGPLWDARSKVLILGSFPSVKSREQQFYYGHPQNRFWKIMAAVCAAADHAAGCGLRSGSEGQKEDAAEEKERTFPTVCRTNTEVSGEAVAFAQKAPASLCAAENMAGPKREPVLTSKRELFLDPALHVPQTTPEKRNLLLDHGIALWDVIESCDIRGSSDASIRNARVNDLSVILRRAPIRKIYVNGATAYRLYTKYMAGQPAARGVEAVKLPSTSPANAAWSLERLLGAWGQIAEQLQQKY